MTSTDVGNLPPQADPDDPDMKISRTIMALLGYHSLKVTDLPKRIDGLKQATLYTRIDGKRPWEAKEVAVLAAFFGLPVGQFYEGRPQLDDSHLTDGLRFSREHETAGQDRFSGADIEAILDAATSVAAA